MSISAVCVVPVVLCVYIRAHVPNVHHIHIHALIQGVWRGCSQEWMADLLHAELVTLPLLSGRYGCSLLLYIDTQTCVTYKHFYIHARPRLHTSACMHAYIYTCKYRYTYICVHTYVYAFIQEQLYIHQYTYISLCKNIHRSIHLHTKLCFAQRIFFYGGYDHGLFRLTDVHIIETSSMTCIQVSEHGRSVS